MLCVHSQSMKLILRLVWQQAKRHPVTTSITGVLVGVIALLWIIEPLYASYAVDALITGGKDGTANYWMIFGYWALLLLAMAVFQALEKYWSWEIDNRLILDRREEVYGRVLNLDVAFHTKQ